MSIYTENRTNLINALKRTSYNTQHTNNSKIHFHKSPTIENCEKRIRKLTKFKFYVIKSKSHNPYFICFVKSSILYISCIYIYIYIHVHVQIGPNISQWQPDGDQYRARALLKAKRWRNTGGGPPISTQSHPARVLQVSCTSLTKNCAGGDYRVQVQNRTER